MKEKMFEKYGGKNLKTAYKVKFKMGQYLICIPKVGSGEGGGQRGQVPPAANLSLPL